MKIRSVFDGVELRSEFENIGIDSKFVPIVWKHLFLTLRSGGEESNYWEWEKHVPSLPSSAYTFLRSNFKTPLSSTLHSVFHSSDNLTSKLLIKLQVCIIYLLCSYFQFPILGFDVVFSLSLTQNGAFVEAVIMRYDTRLGKYGGKPRPGGLRATLCISSQVRFFLSFLLLSSSLFYVIQQFLCHTGWMQNGLQILCNWEYGIQK
jgi:hypothetical protein